MLPVGDLAEWHQYDEQAFPGCHHGFLQLSEANSMEYRKLGNLDVSVIGLGTWRTFDVSEEEEIAVRSRIVDNCLGNDINLIDTAAWYGNAEQVLGEITEERRDQFYLATKVRIEGKEAGEAQIARSF